MAPDKAQATPTSPAPPNVQWPSAPVGSGDTLLDPLKEMLVGLNVLESPGDDQPTLWSTPFSLQVITAGSTTISKYIGTAIAALGGASTVLAGLRAFVGGLSDTVKVGWAGAAAACLVATIIGLALILRADVAGRAEAAAAEYAARQAIAVQFLALGRPSCQYVVKKPGYREPFMPVQSFVLDEGQVKVKVANLKEPLTAGQVEGLIPVDNSMSSIT